MARDLNGDGFMTASEDEDRNGRDGWGFFRNSLANGQGNERPVAGERCEPRREQTG